jgi:hypothetical protein
VTVSPTSDLVGRVVRDVPWQGLFGLVPVAIQRGNGREDGRLSEVVLAAGDVLILDTSKRCRGVGWTGSRAGAGGLNSDSTI